NRLTFLENRNTAGVISSCTYTLGLTGRRDAVLEDTGRRVEYTYDAVDRLTREQITDAAFGDLTIDYSYDAVGNRLTRNDSGPGPRRRPDHLRLRRQRPPGDRDGRRPDRPLHLRRQRHHAVARQRYRPGVLHLGFRQPPGGRRHERRRHHRRAERRRRRRQSG